MFVSVVLEPGSDGRLEEIGLLLEQYGFKEIQYGVWESNSIKEKYLSRLKRDIDRRSDYYDKIRMYQFPLEGSMSITSLIQKRWKKIKLKI